jgi:hypothetical protein
VRGERFSGGVPGKTELRRGGRWLLGIFIISVAHGAGIDDSSSPWGQQLTSGDPTGYPHTQF